MWKQESDPGEEDEHSVGKLCGIEKLAFLSCWTFSPSGEVTGNPSNGSRIATVTPSDDP